MAEDDINRLQPSVINVIMPTYIMTPTEDEIFRRQKVCKLITECLDEILHDKAYHEENAKKWSLDITDLVKQRIRKEYSFPRYKVIVQSFIGQQKLQDIRITSRCLWDTAHDNHASASYKSQHLWATCIVFGLYAD